MSDDEKVCFNLEMLRALEALVATKDDQIAKLHLIIMRQSERIVELTARAGDEPESKRRAL